MNRIQTEEEASLNHKTQTASQHSPPAATSSTILGLDPPCHSFFGPLHYEANYAYPLLVWLHPEGENENHLNLVMPQISMRNYVAVAPRGTLDVPAGDLSRSEACFTWRQTDDHSFLAQQRILAAVEAASRRFHVHHRRVFLAGAGNGGTMAFRVALRHPDKFAGALSLGGAFPLGAAPLARLVEARDLPLFIATGRQSMNYPESAVCKDLRLFHAAGMNITLRQYPGSRDISEMILSDVDRWMMEVIASGKEATVVSS
jgi:phospholipase/carboxylesterase